MSYVATSLIACFRTSLSLLCSSFYRFLGNRKSHKSQLRQIEEDVKAEYIDNQVALKEQEVIDGNLTVRWIMKNWMCFGLEEVFQAWRECVEKSKQLQRRQERMKLRETRLKYEDQCAEYEMKRQEVGCWLSYL